MIRLIVGISELTPGWQSIFQQLGIEVEPIDFSKSLENSYSSLIINSEHAEEDLAKIYRFLNKTGGGCIFTKPVKHTFSRERTASNHRIEFPDEYESSVKSFYLGSGLVFTMDANPDEEWSSNNYKRKRFPFKKDYHPDELVSKINRHALSHTLLIQLKELHYHRKLPFIYKWHSPTKNPFFAFRVDTDFGNKKSISSLYNLAQEFNIRMTWFLHVQAHEEWLDYFQSFKNQEIALHGYEHGTSNSYEHIINNIERGKQKMIDAGLAPNGFCVPYSIWTDTLGDVLTTFDFDYSSEFTLGYDTDPFYPVHQSELHQTLQIPIHPICTGSLNRKKASPDEMIEYFEKVIAQKMSQNENVIFYHHPMQIGIEVWEVIFKKVKAEGLQSLTFSEIAEFWKNRVYANIEASYDPDALTLYCNSDSPELLLNVSLNSNEYYLIEASQINKPLTSFEVQETTTVRKQSDYEKKELSANKFQLLKTSILDWKNRRNL